MRRVLHVGPSEAQGGMATVISTLADNPPEGWTASICNTYSKSNLIKKLNKWREVRKFVQHAKYDLLHIHCASGWSYRRKLSISRAAKSPIVFHIHSGNFDIKAKSDLENYQIVCLSENWSEKLKPLIGDSISVPNPVCPKKSSGVQRENYTLLMGRNDPVKGRDFAYSLGLDDLRVTGVLNAPRGVTALGWVSEEEKWTLLEKAGCLIVPSEYEGQPMVILEALSVGCPVVASTNVPDLPDCVKTAEIGDVKAWKEAIKNPIKTGLENAIEDHKIDSVRERWGLIYDKIIDSRTSTE